MIASARKRRRLFWFVAAVAATLGAQAIACQTAATRDPTPCTPGAICNCAEDPTQPLCKGFNDRPESGFDVGPIFDAGADTSATDASDASADDAADDAADAADD